MSEPKAKTCQTCWTGCENAGWPGGEVCDGWSERPACVETHYLFLTSRGFPEWLLDLFVCEKATDRHIVRFRCKGCGQTIEVAWDTVEYAVTVEPIVKMLSKHCFKCELVSDC